MWDQICIRTQVHECCRHAHVLLTILWLAAVAARIPGTSSVAMAPTCDLLPPKFLTFPPTLPGSLVLPFQVRYFEGLNQFIWSLMCSSRFIMGSTIYCLLCQFHDVLISCSFLLLTPCVYTCGLECFSDKGNIEGTNSGEFYVCVCIFCFMFVGMGFVNLTWVRLKRVFKCAFVYDGVSCPNETVRLTGR